MRIFYEKTIMGGVRETGKSTVMRAEPYRFCKRSLTAVERESKRWVHIIYVNLSLS
jgi:hypothetical protein